MELHDFAIKSHYRCFIIQRPLVDTKILDWIYAENRRTVASSTENIAIMANQWVLPFGLGLKVTNHNCKNTIRNYVESGGISAWYPEENFYTVERLVLLRPAKEKQTKCVYRGMLSITTLFLKRPLFLDISLGVMTNLKVWKLKKIIVTLLLFQRYLNCDQIEEVLEKFLPLNGFSSQHIRKVHSSSLFSIRQQRHSCMPRVWSVG